MNSDFFNSDAFTIIVGLLLFVLMIFINSLRQPMNFYVKLVLVSAFLIWMWFFEEGTASWSRLMITVLLIYGVFQNFKLLKKGKEV
jgi:hypothetical protein